MVVRITVSNLPPNGARFAFDAAAPWALRATAIALDAEPRSLTGALVVVATGGRVDVTGHVAASAARVCERCGEDAVVVVDTDVVLAYEPAAAVDDDVDTDVELADSKLDLGWYENDTLNLEDVVCEAVLLGVPVRVVCDDVVACDARTADLLRSKGSSGDPAHGAFARLKNLR